MQSKYDIFQKNEQETQQVSQELAQVLEGYHSPLLLFSWPALISHTWAAMR